MDANHDLVLYAIKEHSVEDLEKVLEEHDVSDEALSHALFGAIYAGNTDAALVLAKAAKDAGVAVAPRTKELARLCFYRAFGLDYDFLVEGPDEPPPVVRKFLDRSIKEPEFDEFTHKEAAALAILVMGTRWVRNNVAREELDERVGARFDVDEFLEEKEGLREQLRQKEEAEEEDDEPLHRYMHRVYNQR